MKLRLILILTLGLIGCAHRATVKQLQPHRAGFETSTATPMAMLDRYVEAADRAWGKLDAKPDDTVARDDYNYAVARICGALRDSKLAPWTNPIQLGSHTLAWQSHPLPEWDPARYELIPTDQLKISGKYFDQRETKPGLGAPVVAKRVADQLHEYAPTPHFYYAATVVARFEGTRCVLALENPLESETVRIGRRTMPLAADFTAPLAMMLVEMEQEKLGLPRLLHPAKFAATTRIARLAPYDPNKTVVLFVHGLMSSPETWFPLINHLCADAQIRDHYQFWFYSYPSGYPYSYSAAVLRHELDQAERHYPTRNKMIVIGHSMGGCISRLLVTDTGNTIWNQMFTVTPEQMDVTPEHKHILTESTIFTHRPEIGRVIFISTPHRGSTLAANWLTRMLNHLVQLPATLLATGFDEARYLKHAAGARRLDRFPDSVDTLAPGNDFVRALNSVPITPGIPYHTIAGDRGRGDSPNSSDGVVPYWSSHQAGAVSEKIVPSHHPAHQNPEAIAEVERILKENN
ncbi:MAG: alpha/beta fold hydrolase [Verrucomicrobia bacterium]|nr:alpha/beta fold hydrolase [Verrucomicrobiota bacterium]